MKLRYVFLILPFVSYSAISQQDQTLAGAALSFGGLEIGAPLEVLQDSDSGYQSQPMPVNGATEPWNKQDCIEMPSVSAAATEVDCTPSKVR